MFKFNPLTNRLKHNRRGVSIVEYVVLMGLISVPIIFIVSEIGEDIPEILVSTTPSPAPVIITPTGSPVACAGVRPV